MVVLQGLKPQPFFTCASREHSVTLDRGRAETRGDGVVNCECKKECPGGSPRYPYVLFLWTSARWTPTIRPG